MTGLPREVVRLWERRRLLFVLMALAFVAVWALALPTLQVVRGSGLAGYPDGDERLFEPGGMLLLELLRVARPAIAAALCTTAGLALGLAFVSPFALTAWFGFGGGAHPAGVRSRLLIAVRSYPAALGISGLAWLVRASCLLGGALLAEATCSPGAPGRTAACVAVLAIALAPMALTPPLRDLAIADAVLRGASAVDALGRACRVMCALGWPLLAWHLALQSSLVIVGLFAAYGPIWFDLAAPGAGRTFAYLLTAQSMLVVSILLRCLCLERAYLTLVDGSSR